MAHQRQKTALRGALIFALLVALVGIGLAATGHYSNPLSFVQAFQELQHANVQSSTVPHSVGGQLHQHGAASHGHGTGGAADRIEWPYFGEVLFDSWVLCAVTACYIVVQQTLGWLIQRYRSQK